MKKSIPDTYTQIKKLICDWSDKKNCLIHYRMLKFYVRDGMEVVKVHTVISFKQSKWLEKYLSFNTPKRIKAKIDFEKGFYNLLTNSFYGKTMLFYIFISIIFSDKFYSNPITNIFQSKLTFNGIHKSYENYDSYTFKQNEVLMDKPIYLGFSVVELSKLLMYETYYD